MTATLASIIALAVGRLSTFSFELEPALLQAAIKNNIGSLLICIPGAGNSKVVLEASEVNNVLRRSARPLVSSIPYLFCNAETLLEKVALNALKTLHSDSIQPFFLRVQHDIGGFDVTVDDATPMCMFQRSGHVPRNHSNQRDRKSSLLFQDGIELASRHVLHYEKVQPPDVA